MTDRAKLEQMLQYLINEDKEKAEELFHELVVAKSREIYENLLDDDIQVDEESEDEDLDEESEDEDLDEESDDEDLEENFGLDEIGGDPTDDMMGDVEADDDMGDMGDDNMDSSEGGAEAATKDDVMDIKDALEELKAEFEAMLAGSNDSDDDMGNEEEEDEEEDEGDEEDEGNPFAKESVREYVEKVAPAKMGDNGASPKSVVAGKNNMGGTTANIVKGGTSETGGTKGGLAQPNPKDMSTGNVNVPGGNAGKTGFKKKEPGHGAERKGTGDMGDKSAGSPINGAPKRAK
jgi:hypothetical protein